MIQIQTQSLSKQYRHRNGTVIDALSDVSVSIGKGTFATISGPSGSGKSTLLFILGGLLRPTSGAVHYESTPLHDASDDMLSKFRSANIGYVMQNYCLVPYLTAEENVMAPLTITAKTRGDQRRISRALLERVGLEDRLQHYPRELSSGQQQRVAIARALANSPSVILADEPTGNLDPVLATEILSLLRELNERNGMTIVMVTHSPEAAAYRSTKIFLDNGRVEKVEGKR